MKSRRFGVWGLALAFWILGLLFLPAARDPDAAFSGFEVLGTFFYFLAGCLSWAGWGSQFLPFISESVDSFFLWLLVGTFPVLVFGWFIGVFGFSGAEFHWLTSLFLLIGICIGRWQALPRILFKKLKPQSHWIFAGLLLASVLVRLLQASVPQLHSDALFYHLLGPRLWFESGHMGLTPRIPIALEATYWETLFVPVNQWLAEPGGLGLIEGSLYAQWIHVLLGFGGTLWLLNQIFSRWFKNPNSRLWIVAMASAPGTLYFTVPLPKNDYGVALWSFLAFLFALQDLEGDRKAWRGFAVFMGAAFAAKYVTALMLIPLVMGWAITKWKTLKKRQLFWKPTLKIASVSILVITPLLIRNALLLKNPFFPVGTHWFPSPWISDHMQQMFSFAQEGGFKLKLWKDRMHLIWSQDPWLVLGFLGLLFLSLWDWLGILAFVLFCFVVGSSQSLEDGTLYLRLAGPGMIWCWAVMAGAVARILQKIMRPVAFILMMIAALFFTHIPWRAAWGTVGNWDRITQAIRSYQVGGEIKAWLRLNAKPSDLILSSGDNEFYYVAHLRISSVIDQPYLDRMTESFTEPKELVAFFVSIGAKYVLDTNHFEQPAWSNISAGLRMMDYQSPGAQIFRGRDGGVFEVQKLAEQWLLACIKPRDDFEILSLRQ